MGRVLPGYVKKYFEESGPPEAAIDRALKNLRRIRLHKTYEQYYLAALEKKRRWAGKGRRAASLK